MLVHSRVTQVYVLMSAVYQPQNAYCIEVDGKGTAEFKRQMRLMAECFPNIHGMQVGYGGSCGYEIARSVMACLQYLADLNHSWKYYQYLSGVDLPLKTNLEMVRVFERLNGSMNVQIDEPPHKRLLVPKL
ncbi:CBN-GLY-15 protein, partial [Aphelenchoides avenae]